MRASLPVPSFESCVRTFSARFASFSAFVAPNAGSAAACKSSAESIMEQILFNIAVLLSTRTQARGRSVFVRCDVKPKYEERDARAYPCADCYLRAGREVVA